MTTVGQRSAQAVRKKSDGDSPYETLMAGYQFYQVDDEFRKPLMYRPDGDNSIWVTLKVIEWDWDASATCTDAHWTLDSGSTPSSPSGRIY